MSSITKSAAIQHPGETASNAAREQLAEIEPAALRTFTPSLAVIARSAGSYHWTAEGRKLADFSSGVLVANLGHNPIGWWKDVLQYLQLGEVLQAAEPSGPFAQAVPLTAYNACTPLEIEASQRLRENLQNAPGGSRMEHVMWAASGSEAIQKSLWAALAFDPQRTQILATRKGFHGKKGLAGAVTGSEEDSDRDPRVHFVGLPTDECRDLQRRSEPLDVAPYRAELDDLWTRLDGKISCLVTEPYLGGGGSYHPQPAYLQMLEQFCREHNILFILDEIQSNFGRTGPMYAFTHYGLEPDVVCLGKGLGNGVPVSAAVGRADVFASLHYGEASDTWSANPLSAAAVLATLDAFEKTDVLQQGLGLSQLLEKGLQRLKETGLIRYVRGEGCVWGIECQEVAGHASGDVANRCVEACYRGDSQGRAIHLLGPLANNVLRVSPPLNMNHGEAAEYLDVMFDIFHTVAGELNATPATAS